MKKASLFLSGFVLLLATESIAFAASTKATALKVVSSKEANYKCNNGQFATATHYRLSDGSLEFIKVKYKNENYTLPRLLSANGDRYGEPMMLMNKKIEWWEHHGEVSLTEDVNDEEGKSLTCKELNSSK